MNMPKKVRIQLSTVSSDDRVAEKFAEEEGGEFRERQRRRSNASATAGAIKSILKHRGAENEVTSAATREERRASLAGGKKPLIAVNGQEANGHRRQSNVSILSSSSYSKSCFGSLDAVLDIPHAFFAHPSFFYNNFFSF